MTYKVVYTTYDPPASQPERDVPPGAALSVQTHTETYSKKIAEAAAVEAQCIAALGLIVLTIENGEIIRATVGGRRSDL